MTNIIASTTTGNDPAGRRDGMQKAGEKLGEWLGNSNNNDKNDAKEIFDWVFSNSGTSFFLIDESGNADHLLSEGNGKHRYNVANYGEILRIDGKKDSPDGQKPMTIAVPEKVGPGATSYLNVVVTDIQALSGDTDALKNYLLASIFLTRCH